MLASVSRFAHTSLWLGCALASMATATLAGCGAAAPTATPTRTPAKPAATLEPVKPDCSEPYTGPLTQGTIAGVAYVSGLQSRNTDPGAEVSVFAAGAHTAMRTSTTDTSGDFSFTVSPGDYSVGIIATSGTTPLVAVVVAAACNSNVVVSINVEQTTPQSSPTGASGSPSTRATPN